MREVYSLVVSVQFDCDTILDELLRPNFEGCIVLEKLMDIQALVHDAVMEYLREKEEEGLKET
jgi:hypothetical protein